MDASLKRARIGVRLVGWATAVVLAGGTAYAQDLDTRVAELDKRLSEAQTRAQELQQTIAALAAELRALKEPQTASVPVSAVTRHDDAAPYREQVIRPDLAEDERGHELGIAPELFVQSRFQSLALDGVSVEDAPTNFLLTRMETRWSGRLSPKVGLGIRAPIPPGARGSSFEIVNDAFVEYYPAERVSVRVGQFVKPFGFDIQQSSAERESPERGIFAGYFFPGQRDRGVMLHADMAHGVQLFLGAFNGNRFFADSNRKLNYNARVRKLFEQLPLAAGVSAQFGQQLLPDGMTGNDHEHLVRGRRAMGVATSGRARGVRDRQPPVDTPRSRTRVRARISTRCAIERWDAVLEPTADWHGPDIRAL